MPEEQRIRIPAGAGVELEARLATGRGRGSALVCHPHPLYGGTMDNNVVLAAVEALAELEMTSLRFNFRGVGRSTGRFEDGEGEAEDVEAAFRLLAERRALPVHLVAYSFGVYAGLRAVGRGLEPASAVLVAPPVSFMELEALALPASPCLIVAGENDEYCALDQLEDWIQSRPARPALLERVVVDGTDHFFVGGEDVLAETMTAFLGRVG